MDFSEPPTTRALLHWTQQTLAFPETSGERLFEQALRGQWTIGSDVAESAMELSALPRSIREPMAAVYGHILYGELLALSSASRFSALTHHTWAKLFGATQVLDEARHVRAFARVVSSLGAPAVLSPHLVAFGDSLEAASSAEELLVGTQIVLESFAQAVLAEGAALSERVQQAAVRLPGSDAVIAFRDSLLRYVARDEARHLAFGVLCLRGTTVAADPAARLRLERCANDWFERLARVLVDLARPLSALGLDADELARRVRKATSIRLADVGLDLHQPAMT